MLFLFDIQLNVWALFATLYSVSSHAGRTNTFDKNNDKLYYSIFSSTKRN